MLSTPSYWLRKKSKCIWTTTTSILQLTSVPLITNMITHSPTPSNQALLFCHCLLILLTVAQKLIVKFINFTLLVKAFSLPHKWSQVYLFDLRTIGFFWPLYSHFLGWKVLRARIAYICISLETIGPPFSNQSGNSHYIYFATAALLHPSQKNSSILFLIRATGTTREVTSCHQLENHRWAKGRRVSSGVYLSLYVHTVPKASSQLTVPEAEHPVITSGKYRFTYIKIQTSTL